ncbi:MAG: hypothetical protein ACREEM_35840 [Blastocatellia bacterium]
MAVSEMLKQAERLSADEQVELATRLMEQARQTAETLPRNGRPGEASGAELPAQLGVEARGHENDGEDDWLDTLDLKLMPPKRTYTARVRFHYVGRLQPLPYDFGDFFDEDEEEER